MVTGGNTALDPSRPRDQSQREGSLANKEPHILAAPPATKPAQPPAQTSSPKTTQLWSASHTANTSQIPAAKCSPYPGPRRAEQRRPVPATSRPSRRSALPRASLGLPPRRRRISTRSRRLGRPWLWRPALFGDALASTLLERSGAAENGPRAWDDHAMGESDRRKAEAFRQVSQVVGEFVAPPATGALLSSPRAGASSLPTVTIIQEPMVRRVSRSAYRIGCPRSTSSSSCSATPISLYPLTSSSSIGRMAADPATADRHRSSDDAPTVGSSRCSLVVAA